MFKVGVWNTFEVPDRMDVLNLRFFSLNFREISSSDESESVDVVLRGAGLSLNSRTDSSSSETSEELDELELSKIVDLTTGLEAFGAATFFLLFLNEK